MNTPTEIEELWKVFDEGHKLSKDVVLVQKILDLIFHVEKAPDADITMYKRLLTLLNGGGFLAKEEKKFLINYFILLVAKTQATAPLVLGSLRDCSSILDIWPEKQGLRADYSSGTYRKEAFIWFLRMYEVLGNHFLHRRGHAISYSNMELAMKLKEEKCRLHDNEYATLERFLVGVSLFVEGKDCSLSDLKAGLKVMRKVIWKVKEGITKYS